MPPAGMVVSKPDMQALMAEWPRASRGMPAIAAASAVAALPAAWRAAVTVSYPVVQVRSCAR